MLQQFSQFKSAYWITEQNWWNKQNCMIPTAVSKNNFHSSLCQLLHAKARNRWRGTWSTVAAHRRSCTSKFTQTKPRQVCRTEWGRCGLQGRVKRHWSLVTRRQRLTKQPSRHYIYTSLWTALGRVHCPVPGRLCSNRLSQPTVPASLELHFTPTVNLLWDN
jgi:hypothetical protein